MERLKQRKLDLANGNLLEEESSEDSEDEMDKDEEQLMQEKLEEIKLKAAGRIRRRSTMVMPNSPKTVK